MKSAEAVVQRCSVKQVFLEISQNLQESSCARVSFLIKLTLLKKRPWHRHFPVNFAKFLRTPFFDRASPVVASEKSFPSKITAIFIIFHVVYFGEINKNGKHKLR